MTDHDVKDLSLAETGKLKIEWAEQSMPVLRQVRERGRHVVLGRERIRGAERDLRSASLERQHEVRGLRRDVETRGDAPAFERLFLFEPGAHLAKDGHFTPVPARSATMLRVE